MGNWKIIIHGTGCHHNNDSKIDANHLALSMAAGLLGQGQTVGATTLNLTDGNETVAGPDPDYDILMNKRLRRDGDDLIQELKNLPPSRERALAITKLQEAVMWLGMDLKRINEANPGRIENSYPNSKDPSNTKVEPTADGLKL